MNEKREHVSRMNRKSRLAQGLLLFLLGCTVSGGVLQETYADSNDEAASRGVLARLRPSFTKKTKNESADQTVPDAFIRPGTPSAQTVYSAPSSGILPAGDPGWSSVGTGYTTPSSEIRPESSSRYILPSSRANAYNQAGQHTQTYGTSGPRSTVQIPVPSSGQGAGYSGGTDPAQTQSYAKVQIPNQGQTTVPASGLASGQTQPALPELFPLDKRIFDLPFDTLIGHIPENQLKEVRFYVSRDNGNTWRHYNSLSRERIQASPDKSLRVNTGSDGEFWFAVRAVNLQNQEITGTSGLPDWRILVNTTGKPMNSLMNQTPSAAGNGGTGIGNAGTAAAGNGVPAQTQTNSGPRRPQWSPDPNAPMSSGTVSAPGGTLSSRQAQTPQSNSVLYSVMDKGQYTILNRSLPVFRIQSKQPAEQFARRLLEQGEFRHSASKPDPEPEDSTDLSVDTELSAGGSSSQDPDESGLHSELTEQLDSELGVELSEDLSVGSSGNETEMADHSSEDENGAVESENNTEEEESDLLMFDDPSLSEETSGSGIRYVNQPVLDIDYDISTVGTSGVGRVELWATTDNGQTWSKMAEDKDCTSPIRVNLTTDGKYGFQILLFNGAGVGMERPEPGSLPQLEVVLDRVAPQVQLHTIQLQAEFGDLEIQWTAEDPNFSGQPLLFSWSSAKDGPWRSMSTSLQENSGRYTWRIPEKVPGTVFVRADVFDQAQNSTTLITGPVVTDVVRPTGVIIDAKPQK
ncbi:MAG: hypothetical protein J6A23_03690 [Thermoguttaceae bacterium]|nr:hypothetical protein [Thermoguttaceae bacterium]